MENVKEELKKVIEEVMLPETQGYLEDINTAIQNNTASAEDIGAKEDIEDFITELKTIVQVVQEDKLSENEAKDVYEKIITMLNEHEEEH